MAVPSGAAALEQQLNTGLGSQVDPAVFGNTAVWADNRMGNWDIFYYDIPSEIETRLTSDAGNSEKPCIYGNYIVWQDDRNGNYDIYMSDPSSRTPIRVTTDVHNQTSPDIYGPWIVWEDDRNGHFDIYLYDINTKMEMRLTIGKSNQKSPCIFGDTLVYLDDKDGDYEIFSGGIPALFTIDQDFGLPGDGGPDIGEEILTYLLDVQQVTHDGVDQAPPDVWGFNIVWSDQRSFNSDIFYYNMMSDEELRVTANLEEQTSPVIHGNTILWVDFRNGNGDIYQFDVLTQSQRKLISSSGNERSPAIYDDRIIFVSDSKGDADVYYASMQDSENEFPDQYDVITPNSNQDDAGLDLSRYKFPIFSVVLVIVLYAVKGFIGRRGGKEEEEEYIPTMKELNKLKKKDELVELAKDLGLNPYGNKKRLRKRLITYIKEKEEEKRKRDALNALHDAEEQATRDARRAGSRLRRGAGRTAMAEDDGWTAPKNFDYDALDLLWDDGLESTGILGLEEKYALGMLPDFYYEAVYDAWKEDHLSKHAVTAQPKKQSEGRYAPKPNMEADDFALDWDDGYEALGLMR